MAEVIYTHDGAAMPEDEDWVIVAEAKPPHNMGGGASYHSKGVTFYVTPGLGAADLAWHISEAQKVADERGVSKVHVTVPNAQGS